VFDLIFPNLDRAKANTCVACEYKKKNESKSDDNDEKSD
jgi:Lon-like ATP-dependent protease